VAAIQKEYEEAAGHQGTKNHAKRRAESGQITARLIP
jgi:hypothetical protein